MITYLQTHMRRHGKLLLIVVMGLVIVSLLYFGPARSVDSRDAGNYSIYGRKVTQADFDTVQDAYAFLMSLQYGRPIHRNDVDNPEDRRQILMELALAEKAHQMGIRVTDEEVGQHIRALPVFQANGQFNEQHFNELLSNELPKRHLNEKDLQDIVSMKIALARLNELISTTALIVPSEVDEYLRLVNEKLDVVVAKFDEKNFKPTAPAPDAQLQAFYKENAERFRIPKETKVIYAEFPVPASDAPVTEDELRAMYAQNVERMAGKGGTPPPFDKVKELVRKAVLQQHQQEALNKIGRAATDFSLKFATDSKEKPDFKALAAAEHLKTGETDYVASPADLKGIKAPEPFAAEILKLSKENPVSLPVPAGDLIYVAHWLDTRESSVPEFAQVKEKVVELWKRDAALKTARETGKAARTRFGQMIAEGKNFQQATQALGLRWDAIAPFSLREIPREDPGRFFKQSAFGVRAGAAGDFLPDPSGGFFVYVKSRKSVDISKVEDQRPEIRAMLDRNERSITLYEFRRKVIEESGLLPYFADDQASGEM
jgi:peptidyl-prolyl cis-trans isomerase D